jgi:hypothetical protein
MSAGFPRRLDGAGLIALAPWGAGKAPMGGGHGPVQQRKF